MAKKKTKEEFIRDAKNAHGYKYDYSLVEYVNSYTKLKIICQKHGVFEQRPGSHIISYMDNIEEKTNNLLFGTFAT